MAFLNSELRSLEINEFGIAIWGGFNNLHGLIPRLADLIEDSKKRASNFEEAVENDQELKRLAQKGRELNRKESWTAQEAEELHEQGDPRAEAVTAPIIKLLLESKAKIDRIQVSTYPDLIWSSIVVRGVAQWELSLRAYCEYLALKLECADPESVLAADYAGDVFSRFKKLIRQETSLEFDFGASQEWEEMQNHQSVRNIIVHWGGFVTGRDEERVLNFASRSEVPLNIQEGRVVLSAKYAQNVVECGTEFVVDFDSHLVKKYL